MYRFDIQLYVRPANTSRGNTIDCDGQTFRPLDVASGSYPVPFAVEFETVVERLAALPRMFIEPDGSFVWVSDNDEPWQIDGVVYDRAGRVLFAELKGCCPADRFDQLLVAFDWPTTPVMLLLTRHAVFVDEAEFRQRASSSQSV